MQETSLNQMNLSDSVLKCEMCDMRSNSLVSHIKSKHNMSSKEYKEKFPGSKTQQLTSEQIAKIIASKNAKITKNKLDKEERKRKAVETANCGMFPLVCQICKFESMNSLISHITRVHLIKMDDYRLKFPNQKVQQLSPTQRKKHSVSMKKRLENPAAREAFLEWRSFPSEIKHWLKKGFSVSEAKSKVYDFQSAQSLKGNNQKTFAIRSAKTSGNKNPMSIQSLMIRNGVNEKEARKLTPCYGRTGEKHPMFGKKHTDEAIRKIGENINHSGRSKVEHELSDYLISQFGGEKNSPVSGWCVDYVNHEKKIIVEFFGDFWHHNPQIYDSNHYNKLTKRTSSQVWERDARKISELKSIGYNVEIVWESDWRNDKEGCLKRIINAYN